MTAQNLPSIRLTSRIFYTDFLYQDITIDIGYIRAFIDTGYTDNTISFNQLT